MRNDYADVTIVVDRSGSMAGTMWTETINGINALVEDQKKLPGLCRLTVTAFDNEYLVVCDARAVAEVAPFSPTEFPPRGGTALLDAIARAINATGKRLAGMAEEDRPAQVLFVVATDGEENASQEFGLASGGQAKVAAKVKHQQEAFNWRFLFLGANQDAVLAGAAVGMTRSSSLSTAANAQGQQAAFCAVSGKIGSTRSTGNLMNYEVTEADRKEQAAAGLES